MSRLLAFVGVGILTILVQGPATHSQPSAIDGTRILERVIATAGGRQVWQKLNDFRASGTLSLYSNGNVFSSGSMSAAGAGLKRFHLIATSNIGTRIWSWNDGIGVSVVNGHGNAIGRHNLSVLEGFMLPAQKIIALVDSPSSSVQSVEASFIDGRPIYRVRVTRSALNQKEAIALGQSVFTTDILVDQQTFTVLVVEDIIHPNDHTRDSFSHRIVYGDYRSFAGMAVPFSMNESISDLLTWKITLASFEPNVGVPDSEFTMK
jgi:hypothetical protein